MKARKKKYEEASPFDFLLLRDQLGLKRYRFPISQSLYLPITLSPFLSIIFCLRVSVSLRLPIIPFVSSSPVNSSS